MKTIVRKAYWNYEKEENWINEMSAKGFAMTDYSWCRYVFTDCRPGEYIYRIELLENRSSHPVSQKYLRFMEENGVEHVASYMRWVYFRKNAEDGAFDIYSDLDSKIKHYRRINLLWSVLACAEILIGLANISIGVGPLFQERLFSANSIAGSICLGVGIAFLIISHPIRKKIGKLKKDRMLVE